MERARSAALKAGAAAAIAFVSLVGLTYTNTDLFHSTGAGITLWLAVGIFVVAYMRVFRRSFGGAFIASGLAIVFTTVAFFAGLFPRLMVSSLNPAWSLTIHNASSSAYTLKIMTIAAACLVPVVLAYQAWSYWVFRKRVSAKDLEY